MTHIICDVNEGLRAAEATVTVHDYSGRAEYLPVDRHILAHMNGKDLLPVSVIYKDEGKNAAFVQLPDEADSGASRIWVKLADIRTPEMAS